MKRTTLVITTLVTCLILLPALLSAESAIDIMQKVNNRDDGQSQISKIKLVTCRYRIKNRKLSCAETPRVKIMESVRRDYGEQGKDTRNVILILEPPGERGIGFLQYDYDEPGRETDQWMYFSALGKVKRIISGSANEPKTGSFFGTEISYEDMEARHIEDYTYKLLKEETYHQRPCWVIESIPKPHEARKSSYSKSINWIDQERYLTLKRLLYDRQGRQVKMITNTDIEKIDGIWVMRKMMVNSLLTKRITLFSLESTAYNIGVDDEFLTQRTLTDKVFREQHLQRYRSFLE